MLDGTAVPTDERGGNRTSSGIVHGVSRKIEASRISGDGT